MDKFAEPRTFEPLPYRELGIRRFHRSGVFTPSLRDFPVDAIEPIRAVGASGIASNRKATQPPYWLVQRRGSRAVTRYSDSATSICLGVSATPFASIVHPIISSRRLKWRSAANSTR